MAKFAQEENEGVLQVASPLLVTAVAPVPEVSLKKSVLRPEAAEKESSSGSSAKRCSRKMGGFPVVFAVGQVCKFQTSERAVKVICAQELVLLL